MIKNNKECTEDRFLNDVKDHKISIVKDDGGTEIYTFHYIWCLFAIVWGISQYDLAKREVAS